MLGRITNSWYAKPEEPVKVEEKALLDSAGTVDELNQLLYKISSQLVQDRPRLSRWIAGMQQGFATLYIHAS